MYHSDKILFSFLFLLPNCTLPRIFFFNTISLHTFNPLNLDGCLLFIYITHPKSKRVHLHDILIPLTSGELPLAVSLSSAKEVYSWLSIDIFPDFILIPEYSWPLTPFSKLLSNVMDSFLADENRTQASWLVPRQLVFYTDPLLLHTFYITF